MNGAARSVSHMGDHHMTAYIVFVQQLTFDRSVAETCWSKALEREDVIVAEFRSLENVRAPTHGATDPDAAQPRFDSWLTDMEYCDRF
jgi:hypothetical protein